MMHHLARAYANLYDDIWNIVCNSSDGSPAAQAKLVGRIKRRGDVFNVSLTPGKRGRYQIHLFAFTGWDPTRDAAIGVDDVVPEKPWIAAHLYRLRSIGNGQNEKELIRRPLVLITHHALSRAVQRLGVRLIGDMICGVGIAIVDATLELFVEQIGLDEDPVAATPEAGWRVPLIKDEKAVAVAVLKRHERRKVLVAATVLNEGS
jgi:hypothetical protein